MYYLVDLIISLPVSKPLRKKQGRCPTPMPNTNEIQMHIQDIIYQKYVTSKIYQGKEDKHVRIQKSVSHYSS